MNFLIRNLEESKKFKELIKAIKQKQSPVAISGLTDVEKTYMISAIMQNEKSPICLLTYNEIQAQKLCKDLKSMGQKVLYFPKREIATYDYIAESKDLPYERIAVLNQMILAKEEQQSTAGQEEKRIPLIVTTIEAAMQKMITTTNTKLSFIFY